MTFDFTRAMNSVDQVITNSFERNLKIKLVEIEKAVKFSQSKAFKMLSRMITNTSGPPSLSEDTPIWKKLNEDYQNRKMRSGFSSGFFERTGKLGRELNKLSSESVLGTPVVQLLSASGNTTSLISRRGQRTPITRSSSGKLTKLSVTRQKHIISVDSYPAITESLKSNIDEFKYLPTLMAHKLHAVGRPRPILSQYLRWYSRIEIKQAIRRAL